MSYVRTFVVSSLAFGMLVMGCAPRYAAPYPRASYGNPYYDYDRRSYAAEADERYCRSVAEDVSGDVVREGAKGALVGGALGAAVGAVGGAIAGDPGKGAAIGAATGGIGGAVVQGSRRNQSYDDVFVTCMRDRGYRLY